MQVIQALAFIAGGIALTVLVIQPGLSWLYDLWMGKDWREYKRERERQAKARAARWKAAEEERRAQERAQEAKRLERAYEHDARQRAELREKIKNDAG